MSQHAIPPPAVPIVDTIPAEPTSGVELSPLARTLYERCWSRSKDELSTLRELWETLRLYEGMEGYEYKKKVTTEVGILLSLAEDPAREVILCAEDKHMVFQVEIKLRTARLALVNDILGRLKIASDEHIGLVKNTYEKYLDWKRDKARRESFQDIVPLMRISHAMAVEVFKRLDNLVKHKEAEKAQETSQEKRDEKLPEHTRPRQQHPPQLNPLTLDQVKTDIDAPSKAKKNEAPLVPQAPERKKGETQDDSLEGAFTRKEKKIKKKSGFMPKAGDWKCKLCGYWNKPWFHKCGGKFLTCKGRREEDTETVQEDDGEHEKYDVWKPHDHRVGDWQCSICGFFNIAFDSRCDDEDIYNEDPELRNGCSGKRIYAKYIQVDDGDHSKDTGEPEWIGTGRTRSAGDGEVLGSPSVTSVV